MSENLFNKISKILARWNPLDVPHFIASDEYKTYVYSIVSQGKDFDKVRSELKRIIVDQMGLTFSDNYPQHKFELDKLAKEIFDVRYPFIMFPIADVKLLSNPLSLVNFRQRQ